MNDGARLARKNLWCCLPPCPTCKAKMDDGRRHGEWYYSGLGVHHGGWPARQLRSRCIGWRTVLQTDESLSDSRWGKTILLTHHTPLFECVLVISISFHHGEFTRALVTEEIPLSTRISSRRKVPGILFKDSKTNSHAKHSEREWPRCAHILGPQHNELTTF